MSGPHESPPETLTDFVPLCACDVSTTMAKLPPPRPARFTSDQRVALGGPPAESASKSSFSARSAPPSATVAASTAASTALPPPLPLPCCPASVAASSPSSSAPPPSLPAGTVDGDGELDALHALAAASADSRPRKGRVAAVRGTMVCSSGACRPRLAYCRAIRPMRSLRDAAPLAHLSPSEAHHDDGPSSFREPRRRDRRRGAVRAGRFLRVLGACERLGFGAHQLFQPTMPSTFACRASEPATATAIVRSIQSWRRRATPIGRRLPKSEPSGPALDVGQR